MRGEYVMAAEVLRESEQLPDRRDGTSFKSLKYKQVRSLDHVKKPDSAWCLCLMSVRLHRRAIGCACVILAWKHHRAFIKILTLPNKWAGLLKILPNAGLSRKRQRGVIFQFRCY
jgi:hypothetical protein